MKLFIHKGQYGWYVIANNYKDKTDTAFINLYFPPKIVEPIGQEKESKWIEAEVSFTCYKGKVGLTIWQWEETDSPKKSAEDKAIQNAQERIDNKVVIEQDNLPFY